MIFEPSAKKPEPAPPTEVTPCKTCGAQFASEVHNLTGRAWKMETCPACVDRQEKARERQQREDDAQRERQQRWKRFCAAVPPAYRENDPARLPAGYETWQAAADAYQFGPEGLAFIGANATGKTRAMAALLHRLCMDEGRRVLAVPGVRLAEDALALTTGQSASVTPDPLTGRVPDGLNSYLKPLIEAQALFVDDLDKGRWIINKETAAAALYRVLDERRGEGRPVFVTANTGAGLARLFGERGPAIVARLRDLCRVVKPPESEGCP